MPSRKPLPPGRLGLPWLGETVAIARSNHGFYEDHFDKYGPIFKTRLFGVNFVVVSGAEAFHQFNTDLLKQADRLEHVFHLSRASSQRDDRRVLDEQ